MKNNGSQIQSDTGTVLSYAVPSAAVVLSYALWVFRSGQNDPLCLAASALLAVLLLFLSLGFCRQFLRFLRGEISADPDAGARGKRSGVPSVRHPLAAVVLFAVASRILYFIAVYAVYTVRNGYSAGILELSSLWNPPLSAGTSNLNISYTWYASAEYPSASYLPLFPLYPLLVSGLTRATGNRFLSGLILSCLFFVLSSVMLYLTASLEHDHRTAMRAVKYLCILPPSFLLNLPAADSLFLMLSLLCAYSAEKKRYIPASLSGMLAAASVPFGFAVWVPLLLRLFMDLREDRSFAVAPGKLAAAYIPRFLISCLIPAVSFFCARWIGQRSGVPFPWFVRSAELQNTGFTTLFDSLSHLVSFTEAALDGSLKSVLFGIAVPNLVCFVLTLVLLLLAGRRIRVPFLLYGIVYVILAFGVSALFSAPRFGLLCFPAVLCLARITDSRLADFGVSVASLAAASFYIFAFASQWGVY